MEEKQKEITFPSFIVIESCDNEFMDVTGFPKIFVEGVGRNLNVIIRTNAVWILDNKLQTNGIHLSVLFPLGI